MKNKVKYIVILSVLAILGIVYAVFYILYPEATKSTTATVLDYVCSKPLPVIGLSILGLTLAIIKILSVTGIGNRSLSECRKDLADSKEAQEKTYEELLAFEESVNKRIDNFMENHSEQMHQICSNIPNKNVQELGEKFYGREEENSETTTD